MMQVTVNRLSEIKESLLKKLLFGNNPSPELAAILLVYWVQGILGLARLSVSFFLKDELHLSPAEVSALMGIAAIPWVIKPLFGFISDGLPILGYRRRPYLILSGILGVISWVSLATFVDNAWEATLAISLSSLSVAFSDVIVDSLVVERARKETLSNAGSLQSLSWGASAVGGLITAYFSGYLLQKFGTTTVFAITATFPLIVSAVAWLIGETATDEKPNFDTVKQQLKQLKQAVTQKSIWLPTAFVFLLQATPSSDSAFFYFSTNELGFEPEFLGRVRLVTNFASLVGIFIFQRYLKTISFRKMFAWTTVIGAGLGMTTLILVTHTNRNFGIDDQWFSLGDSLILTVMGQIAFMPVLVLAARLCPPGIEATLFALLMSICNLAGLLSHELGALLTYWLGVTEKNFEQLWLLVVITNVSTLLPLVFLGWLPAAENPEQPSINTVKPQNSNHPSLEQKITEEFVPELLPVAIAESSLEQK